MLIVGLGNPGKKYENTYHNMGYKTVSALADLLGVSIDKKECSALTASAYVGGKRVVLALPTTYMNLSGEAVALLMGRYKMEKEEVVIVYDDIDIPSGTVRARLSGSAGSHNGMKDIVKRIGTEFKRVRMGVGRPPENIPLIDFVLMNELSSDKERLAKARQRAAEAMVSFISDADFDKLMRELNKETV